MIPVMATLMYLFSLIHFALDIRFFYMDIAPGIALGDRSLAEGAGNYEWVGCEMTILIAFSVNVRTSLPLRSCGVHFDSS